MLVFPPVHTSHIIQLDIWLKLDDRFPDFMTKLNVIIVTKSLLAPQCSAVNNTQWMGRVARCLTMQWNALPRRRSYCVTQLWQVLLQNLSLLQGHEEIKIFSCQGRNLHAKCRTRPAWWREERQSRRVGGTGDNIVTVTTNSHRPTTPLLRKLSMTLYHDSFWLIFQGIVCIFHDRDNTNWTYGFWALKLTIDKEGPNS